MSDAPAPLHVLLATPRGTCAGVDRAIQTVEEALRRYGPPVYVRHAVVHNRHVVADLAARGAVFVEELDAVPDDRPVVFSAHGVPRAVAAAAAARRLLVVDAVCPLVARVHRAVLAHHQAGRHVVVIGHAGHQEIVGTLGQLPPGAAQRVGSLAEVDALTPPPGQPLAYVTQTTLAVEDAAALVARLRTRFPGIAVPATEDICYATTNRQAAVRALAPRCDLVLVLGSAESSNANRLVEVARGAGCPRALLRDSLADVDGTLLTGVRTLGLTAGASTPEALVVEALAQLRRRYRLTVEPVRVAEEAVAFRLPAFPGDRPGSDQSPTAPPAAS